MTLKEKFLNSPCEKGYINTNVYRAENNVKIADDYAMDILRGYISNKTLQFQQSQGFHSLEQLLLIIKKEKGL
jgi:hypothetical protein